MVPLMQQNQMELNDQQKRYLLWAKETQINKPTHRETDRSNQANSETERKQFKKLTN